MKMLFNIILIMALLFTGILYSQIYSDITYGAGTSIEIQTGADVCAANIYINGTFSGGGTICAGPLPVTMLLFNAYILKNNVSLSWQTAVELNNSGFDVERKKAGGQWQKITFVTGAGTTNEPKSYSYADNKLQSGPYNYRLKQIDYNGSFEYFTLEGEIVISPPNIFSMGQNYPNPSNPKSKIDYEIPIDGKVNITLFDITGREVSTIINEIKPAGYYSAEFDGTNLSSGVYFYRIIIEGSSQKFTKTLKMILVK